MTDTDKNSVHTISVLVENEFGVLARVSGMFAARGFNIDALSVAPTPDPKVSRINLITHGNEQIIEQILKQLNRLIDVLKVVDLSDEDCIRSELMLLKVRVQEKDRKKLLEITKKFAGEVMDDVKNMPVILRFVQDHQIMENILEMLKDFDIVEAVRTGNIAMQKGKKSLTP
jgi:acetolactate synthase-1/3 small subunit